MKNMNSDLTTVVSSTQNEATISSVITQLQRNGIYVEKVLSYDQIDFEQVLSETESQLVLLLLPYSKVSYFTSLEQLGHI